MCNRKPSFRIEIDSFSEKETYIESPTFVSGGCEWYLSLHPKGDSLCDDHVSLYLNANTQLLESGWKRIINYFFTVVNQCHKELYRSPKLGGRPFCAESPSWGQRKFLPLEKFQEEGFLEKDKLIIQVYIDILEATDGKDRDVNIKGFQVLASQVTSVKKIFAEHTDFAEDVELSNHVVNTEYMNVLLSLIEMLEESPKSLPETKLIKAYAEYRMLRFAGFKLDWLKSKLDELSLESKKADAADTSRVQQRLQHLEAGFVKNCLEFKSKEIVLEKKQADDTSRVKKLEERVNNLEVMNLDLKSKLEEFALERKISDDVNGSRIKQQEERIKSLEMMMSELKAGLDKENAKSCADGFFLVDNNDVLM